MELQEARDILRIAADRHKGIGSGNALARYAGVSASVFHAFLRAEGASPERDNLDAIMALADGISAGRVTRATLNDSVPRETHSSLEVPIATAGTPDEPHVTSVSVNHTPTETVVAVKMAHREYAADEHERLWGYSVRIANIVAEGMLHAFRGARPFPLEEPAPRNKGQVTNLTEQADVESARDEHRGERARRKVAEVAKTQPKRTIRKNKKAQ